MMMIFINSNYFENNKTYVEKLTKKNKENKKIIHLLSIAKIIKENFKYINEEKCHVFKFSFEKDHIHQGDLNYKKSKPSWIVYDEILKETQSTVALRPQDARHSYTQEAARTLLFLSQKARPRRTTHLG